MAALSSSTMARSSSASSLRRRLLLLSLSLSLSSASKAIAKVDGKRRLPAASRLDGAEFQCRTCGRRFATFQALGGHRTSHKRPRVRAAGLDLLLGARPGKGGAAAACHDHRCETCGKVFPTGQALGGHMRRHRPAAAVPTAWSASERTAEEALSGLTELEHDDDAPPSRLIQFI